MNIIKEACEEAKLVKRYRSMFADNKHALPENEIRKQATCEIAHLYVEGKLERFHDKGAKEWCKDAADLYNDPASLYFMAQANKGTPGMYLSWLEKAVKAGYAPAVKEWKEGEKSNWKNSDVFTRKRYYIDVSCINCCECLDVCEEFGAIDYLEHVCIDDNYCTGCGKCAEYCQKIVVGAIRERR